MVSMSMMDDMDVMDRDSRPGFPSDAELCDNKRFGGGTAWQRRGSVMNISRREFVGGAAGLAALALSAEGASGELRACIIGDSARGGYGHGMHRVFALCPGVRVVALADPDAAGRAKFAAEAQAERTYADFREMLDEERPDIAAIGPRWTLLHREYLLACAAAGVHGIIEKPLAAHLVEADEMIAAVEAANVKWGIGFNFRFLPEVQYARKAIVEDGIIGEVLEVRGRGKEDHRAGGEDLIVLGTHIFDLMRFFLGNPLWACANITAGGREAVLADGHDATEPVGSIAGDRLHAMFGFANGVKGHFASVKTSEGGGGRWGLDVFGSKGVVTIRQNGGAAIHVLRSASWSPGKDGASWEPLPGAAATTFANPEAERYLPIANSVIACIGTEGVPAASVQDGRAALEMVQAVYAAHFSGALLSLPLQDRRHPLQT